MKKLKYILILLFLVSFFNITPFSYAKFHAIKSVEGSITVPENNYCFNNGIDTLSDCMLVMDSYSKNATEAKTAIKAKGTPDFSKISPTITYRQTDFVDDLTNHSTPSTYTIGESYSFDSSTGLFSLNGTKTIHGEENGPSYVGKYTCLNNDTKTCTSVYLIVEDKNTSSLYSVVKSKKATYQVLESIDSTTGIYKADDDLGETYYYRGNSKNNFVNYAGMLWRIIRRNGDGSIRLMYYNDDGSSNGKNAFTSKINARSGDPTYMGIMYNEDDFSTEPIETEVVSQNFRENSNYYFSSSISYDNSTKLFTLGGSTDDGSLVFGKWKDNYSTLLPEGDKYYYTCAGTSLNCQTILKIIDYVSSTKGKIQFVSYGSTSYENAVKNVQKSTVLNNLENWYSSKILNKVDSNSKLFSDYISDSIFCNDRSISNSTTGGSGYKVYPSTRYGSYSRLSNSNPTPSFKCSLTNDRFTLTTSSFGNKMLKYPIGLITADEAVAAGAVNHVVNPLFYINYQDNSKLWTMSPLFYYVGSTTASLYWFINSTGELYDWNAEVYYSYGVRPVVNLKSTVKLTGGDGTAENPFTVSLE